MVDEKKQVIAVYSKASEARNGGEFAGGQSSVQVGHSIYDPAIPVGGVIASEYWWYCNKEFESLSIKFDMLGGIKQVKEDYMKYLDLRYNTERSDKETMEYLKLSIKMRGIDMEDIETYFKLKDVVEGEARHIANSTPRMSETMQTIIKGSFEFGQTSVTIQPKQRQTSEEGTQSMGASPPEEALKEFD